MKVKHIQIKLFESNESQMHSAMLIETNESRTHSNEASWIKWKSNALNKAN